MVLYTCYTCLFSSNQKNDYGRHLKTKKHLKNISKIEQNMVKSQNEPEKSQKEPEKSQKEPCFFCDYCNLTFITYANKRRHEIHRCKENRENDE